MTALNNTLKKKFNELFVVHFLLQKKRQLLFNFASYWQSSDIGEHDVKWIYCQLTTVQQI